MNKLTLTLAALAASSALFVACKKDPVEPTPVTPAVTTSEVKIQFNFLHFGTPFDMTETYFDMENHNIRFTDLRFYASHIELTNDVDVQVAEFPNSHMLVNAAASASDNLFSLGTMSSPAHVHEAHIQLGLDYDDNHSDPTVEPYPLNVADMMWSWTNVRKFLRMEGYVDMDNNGSFEAGVDSSFAYHCVGDALVRDTHAHVHQDVVAGTPITIQVNVELATLLSNMDLLGNPTAHGEGALNIMAMDSLAASIEN